MQALKAQIQPHFIFNSLNTIYDRVLSQDLETPKQIIYLSNFLRYTVQEASEDFILLEKEVWFIESYISLVMNRHGERVTASFTQEGYLGNYKIPPLLLITYVENAFKHGVEATSLDAWVQIYLRMEKNGLFVFSIKNSHPCISSKGTGQGLANAKRRLALLFPQKHSLIIESNASIFNITLTILLSTYENSETL
ncbi:sensor histidine kinase [Siphonobacter curvatus]|uniref:Signal transduction histidine kinase internal region domain-containing protein n=1 Tax=Siphonobacter curvatus TaxID=2094562 RepID=A0A2S7IEX7_9BACT|nr:histidine kinase [Siphonobacter curvatus]PQA53218.1 hypothetical protein C5O19_25145 [Siphonobacter curvatus]